MRRKDTKTHAHRDDDHVKMEADWSYATASQGKPRITGNTRSQKKSQNRFLLRTLREYDPAGTLSLNFYLPEL